jgi:tetraacyldisaccharide 4'-kinase
MSRTAELQAWLEGIWYGGRRVPRLLAVLEGVYGFLALRVRRKLYASGWFRSEKLPLPVIVVGNVTVGGTGKTPLVIWLVQELARRGWRPGVVSRGYGGKALGAMLVPPSAEPAAAGDEAVLIARATHAPVAVGRKRLDAGRLLVERGDCDVLIADDGLQHWALKRDLEIAVIDGTRRLGNGRLLPAGPLRDPPRRLQRVDYIVTNGVAETGEIAMLVRGRAAQHVLDPGRVVPLSSFATQRVHAVAGIGNPERFFDMLESQGIEVVRHPLADHHAYDGREILFDDALAVLVTEKDAVKCARFAHERLYVVPVEAELPASFADRIHEQLHALKRGVAEDDR